MLRRLSGADEALHAVVDSDPTYSVAHAMAALYAVVFRHPDFDPKAEMSAALAVGVDEEWERSFIDAAAATVDIGSVVESVAPWAAHQERHPADLISLILIVIGSTFSTDRALIGGVPERVELAARTVGDHPVLLGLAAMLAQERFDLNAAERLSRRALELEPGGFDGAHPLSHVYFERGDHAEGADWLSSWLPTADHEADFVTHLHWHHTLHLLALGQTDEVYAQYEQLIGSAGMTGMFDRTSLLWRLQLHEIVPTGHDPVTPTADEVVAPMLGHIPMAFVGAHAALGLAGCDDADGLRQLAATASRSGTPGATDLVAPIASALAARVDGDHHSACEQLLAVEPEFDRLGGSHAQREVFEDTLIDALVRTGCHDAARARLHARLERRPSTLDAGWSARSG